MPQVPYASLDAVAKARSYEKRFQNLPEVAGVILVSVEATPALGGNSEGIQILLGISRRLSEDVGWALIQQVMREEIQSGLLRITAKVLVGVSGACRDESAESANQIA
jgi:hypothetical protein